MRSLLIIFITSLLTFSIERNSDEVSILLADGYAIKGEMTINKEDAPSVLFLHQCNRDQTMWKPLVNTLNDLGYNTLTVDMRGYGNSKSEGYDIDKSFDESIEMKVRESNYDKVTKHFKEDVVSINAFWRERMPSSSKRIIIGASCGGAQATKSSTLNKDIDAMVVVSPSLREHWIEADIKNNFKSREQLPVLAIASEDDQNAMNAINELFKESKSDLSQKMVYKGGRHGEPLFSHDPMLVQYITDWIEKVIK